jgi:hypothetical protein
MLMSIIKDTFTFFRFPSFLMGMLIEICRSKTTE